MARYGDLYTPASNYGQVYRGSLASRQKSVEQAGQNMKDFAGEIYNLVDRQRQRKAQEQEAQSLERERASLQASRKARVEYDKEQQKFQNYISRLNAITKLHGQEQKLIDAKMFPFWGGIDETRKAYKDRVKLFQDAMEQATGDPARMRAVFNNYSDLFPRLAEKDPETGKYISLRPTSKKNDGTGDYALPFDQLQAMSMMSEGTYVESMRDQNVTNTNKYTPGLEATLRHPQFGFGDMLVEVESTRREVKRAQKVSKSADDNNAIKKILNDGSGPANPKEETEENPESSVITSIIGNASAAEIGDNEIVDVPEDEEPGDVVLAYDQAQSQELFNLVEEQHPWINTLDQKRLGASSQMLDAIGIYLQATMQDDTPEERLRIFNLMPKTHEKLKEPNSTPEDIYKEFSNFKSFNKVSGDFKRDFDAALEEIRRTLKVGFNLPRAKPRTKEDQSGVYGNEQFYEDIRKGGKFARDAIVNFFGSGTTRRFKSQLPE